MLVNINYAVLRHIALVPPESVFSRRDSAYSFKDSAEIVRILKAAAKGYLGYRKVGVCKE